MSASRALPTVLRAALLVALLALLNLSVGVSRWATADFRPALLFQPSPDFIGITLAAFLASLLPRRARRAANLVVATAIGLLLFYGLGDAFTQFFYERHFVPMTDLPHLPALAQMVIGEGWIAAAAAYLLPVAILLGGAIGGYALLAAVERLIRATGAWSAAALLPVALGIAIGMGPSLSAVALTRLAPLAPPPTEAAHPATSSDLPDLGALAGRDVYLIIVESYGSTLMLNPDHARVERPFFDGLDRTLRAAGFSTYSGFLVSPTVGGRSWLADSTLLTGIRVDSDEKYQALVSRGARPSLPYLFERAGYSTLLAAPANRIIGGTLADFLHFDRYLVQESFGYRGPAFPFGELPDQFLLNRVRETLSGAHGRRFVEVVTVSSHTPFSDIPPYIPDWDALGDGSLYRTTAHLHFDNNWVTGTQWLEGYLAAIHYSLTTITNFIVRYVPGGALVVIVGDHQPRLPVRASSESWAVPIHVISRDPQLAERFAKQGFTKGLWPTEPPPYAGMERFYSMLLGAASSR